MRRCVTGLVMMTALLALAAEGAAQATGTPTYNAPYRAFTRSEFGVLLSFPEGGGIAPEGIYRLASGRFDIGFKVGFHDRDGADAIILAGVEARQRVITHSIDFPLDGALVLGVGGRFVERGSELVVPIGLSLGRRVNLQGSTVSIVPYVQPTLFILAGDAVGDNVAFALGLGADFRLTPRFDGRLSVGLGDIEGVSIGFVWLH